jgi:hypothetical protein
MAHSSGRYAGLTQRLLDSVLGPTGRTPSGLRRAALERAAELGGRPATGPAGDGVPVPLAAYVDAVARHAYTVTDADVAGLRRADFSEDDSFEITVAAAVGAALARLERGMAALKGGGNT